MTKSFRAAAFAVCCCVSLAALGASGTAPAFGASEILDSEGGSLLPPSVISAARDEGETPVDYTIIAETPFDDDEAEASRASSLAQLVAAHGNSTTRDREEECLAGAVYFEAKAEHLEGQLAVAKVVVNRAASGRFPASLCGVVFQRGQFSFVRGGGFPPIARGGQDWREAVAIARIAREDLWASPVPRALFFHARHVAPGWRLTRIAAVGNHVFYR